MHYSNYAQNTQYSIHDLVQKIDMKYCAISAYLAFYKVQFCKNRSDIIENINYNENLLYYADF